MTPDNSAQHNETTRHWDTITIATVTIATAAIGILIVIAGVVAASTNSPNQIDWPRTLIAVLAYFTYFFLVIVAAVSIFYFQPRRDPTVTGKQLTAMVTYLLFVIQVIFLGATLTLNILFNGLVLRNSGG